MNSPACSAAQNGCTTSGTWALTNRAIHSSRPRNAGQGHDPRTATPASPARASIAAAARPPGSPPRRPTRTPPPASDGLSAHPSTASCCDHRKNPRILYRDSCRWKVTSVGRDLVAGDGLAHRDTEPLVEADRGGVSRRCDRWKLATSEGTHALDERSVQRS